MQAGDFHSAAIAESDLDCNLNGRGVDTISRMSSQSYLVAWVKSFLFCKKPSDDWYVTTA